MKKIQRIVFTILLLLITYNAFAEKNEENISSGEFLWLHNINIAYSHDSLKSFFVGYEMIFVPGFYTLPYPFATAAYFFNINYQFQHSTFDSYIRSQNMIAFPYPILFGIDQSYNLNNGSYDSSPIFGICLYYPGLKILFRRNIFRNDRNSDIIFALSIPFHAIVRQY